MTTHRPDDPQKSLAAALTLIRQFVPTSTAVHLQRHDFAFTGFQLTDVLTADRCRLSSTNPELLGNLIDDTARQLRDLPWDGTVGEDDSGNAHLDLPDGPLPPKPVWTCMTCGFFSDKLTADRDSDHLRYDGAHYPNWHLDDEEGLTS